MNDQGATAAPEPGEGETGPDGASPRTPEPGSSLVDDRPAIDQGGRVNAAKATHGRGDRVGAAAVGVPVQSVGGTMRAPYPHATGEDLLDPGDLPVEPVSTREDGDEVAPDQ